MSPEDRYRIGRWLATASRAARTCERNLAAQRAAAALAEYPELAELARQAILAGDSAA